MITRLVRFLFDALFPANRRALLVVGVVTIFEDKLDRCPTLADLEMAMVLKNPLLTPDELAVALDHAEDTGLLVAFMGEGQLMYTTTALADLVLDTPNGPQGGKK